MTDPRDRIERALAELGAEHRPPDGWEAKVLAAIESEAKGQAGAAPSSTDAASEAQPARPAQWRPWWLAIPLAAVALAGALLWLVLRTEPLVLEVAEAASTPTHREVMRGKLEPSSRHLPLGGRYTFTARGGRHREIRVYRDSGALIAACPAREGDAASAGAGSAARETAAARPVCSTDRRRAMLELSFAYLGSYQIVALAADEPLPASTGAFDADTAAATAAHADAKTQDYDVE